MLPLFRIICISLVSEVEHLFIYLTAVCIYFLWSLSISFVYFSICWLVLIWAYELYIRSTFYNMSNTKVVLFFFLLVFPLTLSMLWTQVLLVYSSPATCWGVPHLLLVFREGSWFLPLYFVGFSFNPMKGSRTEARAHALKIAGLPFFRYMTLGKLL